jgi:hypothetical protein
MRAGEAAIRREEVRTEADISIPCKAKPSGFIYCVKILLAAAVFVKNEGRMRG